MFTILLAWIDARGMFTNAAVRHEFMAWTMIGDFLLAVMVIGGTLATVAKAVG